MLLKTKNAARRQFISPSSKQTNKVTLFEEPTNHENDPPLTSTITVFIYYGTRWLAWKLPRPFRLATNMLTKRVLCHTAVSPQAMKALRLRSQHAHPYIFTQSLDDFDRKRIRNNLNCRPPAEAPQHPESGGGGEIGHVFPMYRQANASGKNVNRRSAN